MADSLLSVGIRDVAGGTKTINIFFPEATTLAQVQGFATPVLGYINGMIDGVIDYARVTLDLTLPGGLRTTPVAGSTVRRGALFSFNNPTRYKWDTYVPAFDPDNLTGTTVNLNAATVDEFILAMVAGVDVSGTDIEPTNGSGEDLTSLDHADETFRK